MEKELMVMLKSENVRDRFIQTVGRSGTAWITSIINAANDNPEIWECEPISVITAGLNAATLRLSLAKSQGHACILPFYSKGGGKKATFIVMVRGLKQLALRTGKYRYINATPLWEGADFETDPMSGITWVRSLGNAKSGNPTHYYAAYEMLTGTIATELWTAEECLEHGKKYSPSFNKKAGKFFDWSRWVTEFDQMATKTVLRSLLMNKGYLDPGDREVMETMKDDEVDTGDEIPEMQGDVIDGEIVEHGDSVPFNERDIVEQLGFD